MICSYCRSDNKGNVQCDFCGAPLRQIRPKVKNMVTLDMCELPFGQLITFHTYDLLLLLRLVRQERTNAYDLMRTVQKAPEDILIDKDTLTFAEEQYRLYTKRMKVIEGILIDRMGYKPKRVDNQLLAKLKSRLA
ncbi:hypothetical protein [Fictibacillus gelatini]|uniref:hypothetical protein n=1 Tax=Fictibacillus gelatini TaxID=225985 RepID=UPI000423E4DC|nr:hypothetical protein [Fictibacillus gelatini]